MDYFQTPTRGTPKAASEQALPRCAVSALTASRLGVVTKKLAKMLTGISYLSSTQPTLMY